MPLEDELEAFYESLEEASSQISTAISEFMETIEARIDQVRDFRSALHEEVQALTASSAECIAVVEERINSLQGEMDTCAELVTEELSAFVSELEVRYRDDVFDFSTDDARALVSEASEAIEDQTKTVTDALSSNLDAAIEQSLSHVKSTVNEMFQNIVHEFDKGADDSTKEVAAFRPVLREVERCIQPVISSLEQIMGIAHSVGF